MNYQTFRGADMKEALAAVRTTFGPDAIIGSTSRVSNGRPGALGTSWVEVLAAPPPAPQSRWGVTELDSEAERDNRRQLRERAATLPTLRTSGARKVADADEVERKLQEMQSVLEEIVATRPPRERVLGLLDRLGVEGQLARSLATGVPRSTRDAGALRGWLETKLGRAIKTDGSLLTKPGPHIIAAVGPTGVGKTTTLAKIAAKVKLELQRSVAVISLDGYRVGAVEQWQRYAQIMGIPFHSVGDAATFHRVVSQIRCDVLLVDTAGPSAADVSCWDTLRRCLRTPLDRPLHVQLVLPAWIRGRDAELAANRYAELDLSGLVVSKLDETTVRGGALHAMIPRGLPVTFLCDGPRVPEDLHAATTEAVLAAVFTEDNGGSMRGLA